MLPSGLECPFKELRDVLHEDKRGRVDFSTRDNSPRSGPAGVVVRSIDSSRLRVPLARRRGAENVVRRERGEIGLAEVLRDVDCAGMIARVELDGCLPVIRSADDLNSGFGSALGEASEAGEEVYRFHRA